MLPIAALGCGFIFGWGSADLRHDAAGKGAGLSRHFRRCSRPWDPSLAVVMAAALAVSGLGYALAKRRARPLLAARMSPQMFWPTKTEIDRPLVIGSALFGAGWGLVGLCPGPALENLATLSPRVIVFVIAMAAGMALHDFWQQRQPTIRREAVPAAPAVADG